MRKLSIKTAIIAILSFSFVLTSCNTALEVTKRKYRKGYHVTISNSKKIQGRNIEESIEENKVQHSVYHDFSDSRDIVKSEELDQFTLSKKSRKKSNNFYTNDPKTSSKTISPSKKNTLVNNFITAKKIKKQIRNIKHQNSLHTAANDDDEIDSDLMFVLLLLLAVILPPACVYMIKGKDSFPFKLNLVSWLIGLLGWGLFRFLTIKFIWLATVFAIVHAIFVLLGQT